MEEEKYSVSWDAYQKSICSGLSLLQQKGEFVDMTLAADGHHVKAHQMVLSLVSPYIRDLISSAACPHPVIFLYRISYETLQSILQYAYTGEVVVSNNKIQEFLNACKDLHIRGLENMESFDSKNDFESTDATGNKAETGTVPKKRARDGSYGKPLFVSVLDTKGNESPTDCYNDDGTDMEYDNTELHKSVKHIEEEQGISIKNTADTTLKISVSEKGASQIVLNRYLYNMASKRRNGDNMWRCINYRREKCPAFIVVKGYNLLKRSVLNSYFFTK